MVQDIGEDDGPERPIAERQLLRVDHKLYRGAQENL